MELYEIVCIVLFGPIVIAVCCRYRSGDNQEVLFEQIQSGHLEFPSPSWDGVSDAAMVKTTPSAVFFFLKHYK